MVLCITESACGRHKVATSSAGIKCLEYLRESRVRAAFVRRKVTLMWYFDMYTLIISASCERSLPKLHKHYHIAHTLGTPTDGIVTCGNLRRMLASTSRQIFFYRAASRGHINSGGCFFFAGRFARCSDYAGHLCRGHAQNITKTSRPSPPSQ